MVTTLPTAMVVVPGSGGYRNYDSHSADDDARERPLSEPSTHIDVTPYLGLTVVERPVNHPGVQARYRPSHCDELLLRVPGVNDTPRSTSPKPAESIALNDSLVGRVVVPRLSVTVYSLLGSAP